MNINPNIPTYPTPPQIDPNTEYDASFSNDTTPSDALSSNRDRRVAADPKLLWPQGSTLKISLARLSEDQKKVAKDNINKWAAHVNLQFEFVDTPEGDIRVGYTYGVSSSWVGTSAKDAPPDQATMIVNFNGPDDDTARLVQHEFGHALGLKHEHQHPDRTLKFIPKLIYAYYGENKKHQADRNVLDKYDPKDIKTSAYDPHSIMHYHFPAEYMHDGVTNSENYKLSPGDQYFIQTLYPNHLGKPKTKWPRVEYGIPSQIQPVIIYYHSQSLKPLRHLSNPRQTNQNNQFKTTTHHSKVTSQSPRTGNYRVSFAIPSKLLH